MGSSACFSHFITVPVLEQLVKNDVAAKAEMIIGHEAEFKQRYLQRQSSLADKNQADVKKDLKSQMYQLHFGQVRTGKDGICRTLTASMGGLKLHKPIIYDKFGIRENPYDDFLRSKQQLDEFLIEFRKIKKSLKKSLIKLKTGTEHIGYQTP